MSTIDDLVAAGAIVLQTLHIGPRLILTSLPSGSSDIRVALQLAYDNVAVRNELFSKFSPTDPLNILLQPGQFASLRNDNTLILDPTQAIVYFDPTGVVRQCSLARAVVHEMIHALDGPFDTTDALDGSQANPNYIGATVALENSLFSGAFLGRAIHLGLRPLIEFTFR